MKKEHDKDHQFTLSELIFLITPLGLILATLHLLLGNTP